MVTTVSINKLKPHPKNKFYFTDLSRDRYDEVKRSIAEYGIRDPIKSTTDYTIISGHQRLRIAQELGLKNVPVIIVPELTEDKIEYLLIAENVERRGQAETDPIKKARIAKFIGEHWGVKQGKKSHNALIKNTKDIGEFIGESEHQTKRILKLNDLIPQLQSLVSSGKLGTTAAEQLAYLSPEVQQQLLNIKGDLSGTTVNEAKGYREVDKNAKSNDTGFLEELNKKEEQIKQLQEKLTIAQNQQPIEKEVVVEIDNTNYEAINKLQEQLAEKERSYEKLKKEKELIEESKKALAESKEAIEDSKNMYAEKYRENEDIKRQLEQLTKDKNDLGNRVHNINQLTNLVFDIEKMIEKNLSPVKYSKAFQEMYDNPTVIENLTNTISIVRRWCDEIESYLPNSRVIIGNYEEVHHE